MAKKTCTKCKVEKDLNEFEVKRNQCKQCRKHTPEYNRNWKYQTKYGITLDDYDKMLLAQNGKCKICNTSNPGGPGKSFAVDHNHNTLEIRGLLCNNCNRGLGHFQDNPSLLSSALNYLLTNGHYGTKKES
jgi:hypothetical protein